VRSIQPQASEIDRSQDGRAWSPRLSPSATAVSFALLGATKLHHLSRTRASFLRHSFLDVTVHFTSPKSVLARCESSLIRTKPDLSLQSAAQSPNRVRKPPTQSQRPRPLFALLDRVDYYRTSPETRVVGQPSPRAFIIESESPSNPVAGDSITR
jgi:hypothetical protein